MTVKCSIFFSDDSGPIHAHILAHPEAIQLWRKIMGPTKSFVTQYEAPDTIRGSFGLTDTRNCTHGSGKIITMRFYVKPNILS